MRSMPKSFSRRGTGAVLALPARHLLYLLGVCLLPLLALDGAPALAHADSPSARPLLPHPVRLKYQTPAEIVALFALERLPGSSGEGIPRAACSDEPESLVPGGVSSMLRTPDSGQVVLVGTEGFSDVRDCIAVLDAPIQNAGQGRQRIVLTPRHADPNRVRRVVLGYPGAGTATVNGRQLVLEGTRDWLHRALRQVIRGELRVPDSTGVPARRE